MILSILAATPIVGALVLALLPRGGRRSTCRPRYVALGVSLRHARACRSRVLAQFDIDSRRLPADREAHVDQGASAPTTRVGVNGIGLTLILLTTILVPIVILASWRRPAARPRRAPTRTSRGCSRSRASRSAPSRRPTSFLFYVLFEATLIPLYFLIGTFGGPNRSYAAVKFLIYNLVGGLLMLAAIVGPVRRQLARRATRRSCSSDLKNLDMSQTTERLLFLGLHGRVRDQGAAVAAAHVAARRGRARRRPAPRC